MLTASPFDGETILPLALLKKRVRILSDDEDTDLQRMRAQAIDHVERYSGVSLQSRSFEWAQDGFTDLIRLPVGPVVSVQGISYYSTDGADTELVDGAWLASGGMVMAAHGTSWPFASYVPGGVRITFTAGLTNAEEQAPMLIAAVEVGVAALRASRDKPDWSAADACADAYRMPGL
jgi:uncharacterized phiE125 gp8 family phage protein